MGGDQGVGTRNMLHPPQPLPGSLFRDKTNHQREGLFIVFPVNAIHIALLRSAARRSVIPTTPTVSGEEGPLSPGSNTFLNNDFPKKIININRGKTVFDCLIIKEYYFNT